MTGNQDRWPWNHKPPPPQGPRPPWWRPFARSRWASGEFVRSLLTIPHVTEFDDLVESYGGVEGMRAAMPAHLRSYLDPMVEYMDEKRRQR